MIFSMKSVNIECFLCKRGLSLIESNFLEILLFFKNFLFIVK